MIFRIIGDTIEFDGLPVATIMTSVWPTRRDYLVETLEAYDPDEQQRLLDEARDERDDKIAGLREEIENLQAEKAELENEITALEDAQNG